MREEVPLAVQLANKTKERGTVMDRIEHYRNVCRDLETKLTKQSELLDEAVERKATLQDEINDIEAQIAAAEARDPPVPPPGPALEVPIVLLPPPACEDEEDEEMENEASATVIKSTFRKRASLRLTETRSFCHACKAQFA